MILIGDLMKYDKVDLIKYDNDHPTNGFLDSLSAYLFLPHITQSTRIRDSSKTLLKIFSQTY